MNRRKFIIGSASVAAIVANIGVYSWRQMRNRVAGLPGRAPMPNANEVSMLAFSKQGQHLVSLTPGGRFTVWDANTQRLLVTWTASSLEKWVSVDFLTDDSLITTTSEAGIVKSWIPKSKSSPSFFMVDQHPTAFALLYPTQGVIPPPVRAAIAVADNSIRVVEKDSGHFRTSSGFSIHRLQTGANRHPGLIELALLEGHKKKVNDVCFSRDNNLLASGSDDRTVKIWSGQNWRRIGSFDRHDSGVKAIAISPNNKLLVSGSAKGILTIWDLKNLTLLKVLHGHSDAINNIFFSSNSKWIVSAARDKTTRLWSLDHNFREGLKLPANPGEYNFVDMSQDGNYIASSWGKEVKFWEMKQLVNEAKRNLAPALSINIHAMEFCDKLRC